MAVVVVVVGGDRQTDVSENGEGVEKKEGGTRRIPSVCFLLSFFLSTTFFPPAVAIRRRRRLRNEMND